MDTCSALGTTAQQVSTFEELKTLLTSSEPLPNPEELKIDYKGEPSTEDPFDSESLPPTLQSLKSLSLNSIPLYPAFQKINTLTKFIYAIPADVSVDTVLDFLEHNVSLMHLELYILSHCDNFRSSTHTDPISNRLKYLKIVAVEIEYLEVLIPRIHVQSTGDARLAITSWDILYEDYGMIVSDLNKIYFKGQEPPTIAAQGTRSIELSRPGSTYPTLSLSIDPPTSPASLEYFKKILEPSDLSFKAIQNLVLVRSHNDEAFNPSMFPALDLLVICNDTKLSTTLSKLFSSPHLSPPTLRAIAFQDCNLSEGFKQELAQFAECIKKKTCWDRPWPFEGLGELCLLINL